MTDSFSQDTIHLLTFTENLSKLPMNLLEFLSQFSVFSVSASFTIFQLEPI